MPSHGYSVPPVVPALHAVDDGGAISFDSPATMTGGSKQQRRRDGGTPSTVASVHAAAAAAPAATTGGGGGGGSSGQQHAGVKRRASTAAGAAAEDGFGSSAAAHAARASSHGSSSSQLSTSHAVLPGMVVGGDGNDAVSILGGLLSATLESVAALGSRSDMPVCISASAFMPFYRLLMHLARVNAPLRTALDALPGQSSIPTIVTVGLQVLMESVAPAALPATLLASTAALDPAALARLQAMQEEYAASPAAVAAAAAAAAATGGGAYGGGRVSVPPGYTMYQARQTMHTPMVPDAVGLRTESRASVVGTVSTAAATAAAAAAAAGGGERGLSATPFAVMPANLTSSAAAGLATMTRTGAGGGAGSVLALPGPLPSAARARSDYTAGGSDAGGEYAIGGGMGGYPPAYWEGGSVAVKRPLPTGATPLPPPTPMAAASRTAAWPSAADTFPDYFTMAMVHPDGPLDEAAAIDDLMMTSTGLDSTATAAGMAVAASTVPPTPTPQQPVLLVPPPRPPTPPLPPALVATWRAKAAT